MKEQPKFSINLIPRTKAVIHGEVRNDMDGYRFDLDFVEGYLHTYCENHPAPNTDLYLNSNSHYVSNRSDMRVGYTVVCYSEGNVMDTAISIATELSEKFKHRRMLINCDGKTYELINNTI